MKTSLANIIFLLGFMVSARAQQFPMDTLQYTGDVSNRINIVLLADGYTSAQQDTFIQHAKTLATYFLGQSPWSHYRQYCNVFAIKVISNESGIKHPKNAPDCNTDPFPASDPDNYFGSSFDAYGTHRLVVAGNSAKVGSVLASTMPSYTVVLIVANSTHYGGSGGSFAVATVHPASNEIACHETGHSFGYLADEYWAGAAYAIEKPNMTQESDPAKIKWKTWLTPGTTIGINQYTGGYPWYHPSLNCKMQVLGDSFCHVCQQAIIEKIHSLVNPVEAYSPDSSTLSRPDKLIDFKLALIKPSPNTLQIIWKLDGTTLARNKDSLILDQTALSKGTHNLIVSIADTTAMVRDSAEVKNYINQMDWTISKTITSTELSAAAHSFAWQCYPNPAIDILHVSLTFDQPAVVGLSLFSPDGKLVHDIRTQKVGNGIFMQEIPISDLPKGTYLLVMGINGETFSRPFIKIE